MMDKTILEQYSHLKAEERDLIRRIQSLDARILNMETNMIVSDTVARGKKGKQSLGTVRIEGFPSRDYQKRKRTLRKYKQMLSDKDDELLDLQLQVEEYIQGIEDSYQTACKIQIYRRYDLESDCEEYAYHSGRGSDGFAQIP